MPVHFKGQFKPKGKILVRRINFEDWWLVSEEAERFDDWGLVTDRHDSSEDWGALPKPPTNP